MTRVVTASAESDTLRVLLRSVCKCWRTARKQTTAGCLPCQWSADLVSGLIAWLWASLPLQREAGSVSNRLEQQNGTEDGWGRKKKSTDNHMVLKTWTPVKLHTLWEASPVQKKLLIINAREKSNVSLQRWWACSTPHMDHKLRKMGLFHEGKKTEV